MFNNFLSIKLFTPFQSGFFPADSSIGQLLSIIHELQTAYDNNHTVDVKGVFLDISKALDKVLHDVLIFKLKSCGAEGELLSLLKNLQLSHEQRVVLN